MARQEEEPPVAGDGDGGAYGDGAEGAERVVVVTADQLGREVPEEVDERGDAELGRVWAVALLVTVPVEEASSGEEVG